MNQSVNEQVEAIKWGQIVFVHRKIGLNRVSAKHSMEAKTFQKKEQLYVIEGKRMIENR